MTYHCRTPYNLETITFPNCDPHYFKVERMPVKYTCLYPLGILLRLASWHKRELFGKKKKRMLQYNFRSFLWRFHGRTSRGIEHLSLQPFPENSYIYNFYLLFIKCLKNEEKKYTAKFGVKILICPANCKFSRWQNRCPSFKLIA